MDLLWRRRFFSRLNKKRDITDPYGVPFWKGYEFDMLF